MVSNMSYMIYTTKFNKIGQWSKLTRTYYSHVFLTQSFCQKTAPNFFLQPYSHKKTAPRRLEMLQEQPRIRWEVPLEAPWWWGWYTIPVHILYMNVWPLLGLHAHPLKLTWSPKNLRHFNQQRIIFKSQYFLLLSGGSPQIRFGERWSSSILCHSSPESQRRHCGVMRRASVCQNHIGWGFIGCKPKIPSL